MFKTISLVLILVNCNSVWAADTLANLANSSDCSVVVKTKPIVFGRGVQGRTVGEIGILANSIDYKQIRQLPVGRSMRVQPADSMRIKNWILLSDSGVNSVNLIHDYTHTELSRLTVEEFEKMSNDNLTFECTASEPVNF